MDKSKLAKSGTVIKGNLWKGDDGRPKASRPVEGRCCCCCGCPGGKCTCGDAMCMKTNTGS